MHSVEFGMESVSCKVHVKNPTMALNLSDVAFA